MSLDIILLKLHETSFAKLEIIEGSKNLRLQGSTDFATESNKQRIAERTVKNQSIQKTI
jgi:hypothetical protein